MPYYTKEGPHLGLKFSHRVASNEEVKEELLKAALEGRNDVYDAYIELTRSVFGISHPKFWTVNRPSEDQLRALYVDSTNNDSDANGINSFNNITAFVRVAHAKNTP